MACYYTGEVIERETRHIELRLIREQQFCGDLLLDSPREIRRGLQIEWNDDGATQ